MERGYNFSAGPSMMPLEVLEQAQRDLLCYPGAGCSVMEMSHRTPAFEAIIGEAEAALRRVMRIPEDYAVLFMQGGATTQFSCVAMNLAARGDTMDYAVTGQFAGKAMEEGARWGNAVAVTSSKAEKFTHIPAITPDLLDAGAAFVDITGNNTIYGTDYRAAPPHGDVPLVADWSSAILGREIDVRDYDLIYAGAQKNLGPAGLAVVILRRALLDREIDPVVPIMLRYKVAADNGSMYNTPPTWSIYIAKLMFEWVERQGGVAAMQAQNEKKSALLYDAIDSSALFRNPVRRADRSIMNVTFTLPTQAETDAFLSMAKGRGLINLKGHRIAGGCRASLYNGMPLAGVEALVRCMRDFEKGERA